MPFLSLILISLSSKVAFIHYSYIRSLKEQSQQMKFSTGKITSMLIVEWFLKCCKYKQTCACVYMCAHGKGKFSVSVYQIHIHKALVKPPKNYRVVKCCRVGQNWKPCGWKVHFSTTQPCLCLPLSSCPHPTHKKSFY